MLALAIWCRRLYCVLERKAREGSINVCSHKTLKLILAREN
jgi:hypothetical protein